MMHRLGRRHLAFVAGLAVVVVSVGAFVLSQQSRPAGDRAAGAIYLTPSFNGSNWIRIDPLTLQDVAKTPLLPIAATSLNSSYTLVPQDGSLVLVADFPPQTAKLSIYDGRTGALRGALVPQIGMVIDAMSADGTSVIGRIGTTNNPIIDPKAVVSVADGHVIRRVPAASVAGEIQAWPVAPDLSAFYFFTTPARLPATPDQPLGLRPVSLIVQDTVTGTMSATVPLPGITAGAMLSFGSPTVASTPTTYRPGIALSADGARLAVLSFDGRTLDLIDSKTLSVTTVPVRPKVGLLNLRGPIYTTTAVQRIDVSTGAITAERQVGDEGTYGFHVGADGASLYMVVRSNSTATAPFVLRRLDATTLETRAERQLDQYSELQMLAAP